MPVLGIPHVVVREPVNVGVERTIGVDVHVRNEDYCVENHLLHHSSKYDELNFTWDI